MAKRILFLLLLVLAAGAATARPAAAQDDRPPETVAASIADGSAQRALDAARGRWARLKIRSYDYQVKTTCFCPYTGWVTVKVRNGVISRRSRAAAGELASVPRLFRVIQRAIDDEAHRFSVGYGARGLPVALAIDRRRYVADDEWGFDVRRFRRR